MDLYLIISFIYLISSFLYCTHLWTQNQKVSAWGLNTIKIGVALHSVSLIIIYLKGDTIAGGLDRSLYFFSWFIAIVYIASQSRFKASVLGAFVAPLAFLMTIPSVILPQGIIEHDSSLRNPWILIHIALVFLGEALFTIAFIAGVLYLFQEKQIKSKRLGTFLMKLPSLTSLDQLNHVCLVTGFPLLTLGLALGLLSAKEIWGTFWRWGPKETWSVVTWFLYAVLIHGRLATGWRGRRAALWAVVGFGVVLFTFFVIGYFAPGRHDFLGTY
ncbi:MAG: cytochrome c biogenesis protein [Candidatus Dadabacteria bacterium]|nr:cytochrome c biogenesis protein [Candidatus Dadabacteria bacterium]